MSAQPDTAALRPGRGRSRGPHLEAVPAPVRARLSRVPFLLVLAGTLGLGMAGLLVLNTTVQTDAVEVRALQSQLTTLSYTEAELKTQLDLARSPGTLATRASDLGMRPNPYPAFIDLETGEVSGEPKEVEGDELESLITRSDSSVAAERAAAERERAAAAEQAAQQREQQTAAEQEDEPTAAEREAAAAAAREKEQASAAREKEQAAAEKRRQAAAEKKEQAAAEKRQAAAEEEEQAAAEERQQQRQQEDDDE